MHTLFHIYGPFAVHSYGLAIAIGLLAFTFLFRRDRRFKELNLEKHYSEILFIGIIAAILGGRILFLLSSPDIIESPLELFTFWKPGFSILGAILAVLIVLPWYLRRINVPIIKFFDLAAIYVPLLQSLSRTGCFFAGCCFGMPTSKPWGIIYTESGSAAPLYVCLHPTQLYSAISLMFIFILMYFILQYRFTKTGQLIALYLMLVSGERFLVDFWRGDRTELTALPQMFSVYQYLAAGIFIGAAIFFFLASRKPLDNR